MPVNWMDVAHLPFESLLLLESVQLGWLPGWLPEKELATALRSNPCVEWYLRHKNPALNEWLDQVMSQTAGEDSTLVVEDEMIRQAEIAILRQLTDLLVYAVAPEVYAEQPFLKWDDDQLTSLVEFQGKRVLDVGAGTGRLAFVAARAAEVVWAVEPVANLRRYLREKAERENMDNFYAVDGTATAIPFPDSFFDVVMGGHVFGDYPEEEYAEMIRVVRPGGLFILCPGGNDEPASQWHDYLVQQGCQWDRFEEPGDGFKRKYWKQLTKEQIAS